MHIKSSHIKLILIFLLIIFSILSLLAKDFLSIESIKTNKEHLSFFIDNNYFISVFIFFISCVVFVNSPIPFAAIIKTLSGFLFGFYIGALFNIIATILACLAGFGISRYVFKEKFETLYFHKLKSIENEIAENGFYYFFLLRIIMVVPYFVINILAGISRVSFTQFFFSTALGVIPASLVYANGGSKLEKMTSFQEIFSSDILFSVFLIALLSLLPILKKKLNNH